MKRIALLAVLAMAAMAVLAPATMAQDKLNCVEVSNGDAETIQQEAQALLDENPNGPAQNLDANGNGIACEYTISAQSGTQFEDGSGFISGAQAAPSDAMGQSGVQGPACAELGDSGEQAQQEAQTLLNQDPSDPNGLDANGNGIPCEFTQTSGKISYEDGSVIYDVAPGANLQEDGDTTDDQYSDEPAPEQPAPTQPAPVEPAPTQPTSGVVETEVLPDTGGASLLALGAGALLVAGGLLIRRTKL